MDAFWTNDETQYSGTFLFAFLLTIVTGCEDSKSAAESEIGGANVRSVGGAAGRTSVAAAGAALAGGGTSTVASGATESGGGAPLLAGGVASIGGSTPTSTGGGFTTGGGTQTGGAVSTGGSTQAGGTVATGGRALTAGANQAGGIAGRAAGGAASAGGAAGNSTRATGGSLGVAGARAGWIEEWATPTVTRFYTSGSSPNAASSNVVDNAALDGKALQLTLGANAQPTPAGGAEVGTNARMQFGTFSSRLRTADCTGQPNAGVVTGLFTYFNDGTDSTGDGLPDNSEIDFEWLCAEPQTLYLTMWTDYRDSDAVQKRVSRGINLATGTILYSCYYTAFGDCTQTLSGVESAPGTVAALPAYDSSAKYYEYGFDWGANRVVWWFRNPADNQKIVLWDYQGPKTRITQVSAAFLTNVWHTSDWTPNGKPSAIAAPTQAVNAWVDWTRYEAP